MISLGLYISKESFFIAEVCLSGQKPKILYIEEVFWLNLKSEEEKMALLSKKIEEREQVYKGQSLRICCSLPQNFVSSFSLQLPFKERFKILKTIPFEVEDHTPFQSNKVLFDVKVCQIESKNKAHVLSFVTPEESVQDFLKILQGLNRPIHLLSCSAASLANLLETWNTPLSKAQNPDSSIDTYLYLGIESSYLFFYNQGFLRHVSVLDWGCGGIVEGMQAAYKLSREKVWREFFNKAFLLSQIKGFTKEQVFFSNLVRKHIEDFIPKFNLLKMSLIAQKDIKVSQMVLFGPGAMIKNLSAFLSERLALSVYKSKHLTAFPNWSWREKPAALIAVGLTLEGLKRYPYPGLDFLHFKKQDTSLLSLKNVKSRVFIYVSAFFVFISYAFVKNYETDKVLYQVQTVFKEFAKKIAYLPSKKIEIQEVESFLKKQDEKHLAENEIQKELQKSSPIKALEKIVMKIGSAEDWSLSLEHLKISGLNVEMRGSLEAGRLKSFQSLMQTLASTKVEGMKKLESRENAENSGDRGEVKGEEETEAIGDKGEVKDEEKTEAIGDKGEVKGEKETEAIGDKGEVKGEKETEAIGDKKNIKTAEEAKEADLKFDGENESGKTGNKIKEVNKRKKADKIKESELDRADFSFSFKLKADI